MGDKRKMSKEGYQPLKTKKTIKIIPPNTGSNVQMKKDGYTWEDLDRSFWEGFDNAKNKMEKQIAELEAEVTRLRNENLDIINKYTRFAETDRRTIAGLEAQIEKMKWHKVSDGDLPKDRHNVYVVYLNGYYQLQKTIASFRHKYWVFNGIKTECEIIAWCELPKWEIKEK
jgi:hypothetical protein